MPEKIEITMLEGVGYEIYLTLKDSTAEVNPAEYDVYGAVTNGGNAASFTVSETGEAGQWLAVIPPQNIKLDLKLPFQLCARRRSTGHEWLILYGSIKLVPRIAQADPDKLGTPYLKTESTLATDSTAITKTELTGVKGDRGYSTYDIACQQGFDGTEEEWLASIKAEYASEAVQAVAPYKEEARNAAVDADISATDAAQSAKDAKGSESRAQEQATIAEAHKDTACEYMNAAAGASTFAMRQPVYAKLGEPMEDGTPRLDWGHYVTNWAENGYTEFASLEEAKEHFNITEQEEQTNE